jgi:hypothetical protein
MYTYTTLNLDVTHLLDNVIVVNQLVIHGLVDFIKDELRNLNHVKLSYHYSNNHCELLMFFKSLKEFEDWLQ